MKKTKKPNKMTRTLKLTVFIERQDVYSAYGLLSRQYRLGSVGALMKLTDAAYSVEKSSIPVQGLA